VNLGTADSPESGSGCHDDRMVSIRRADPADAGEVLTVQRAAFVTEAQLHDDPHLAPSTTNGTGTSRYRTTASIRLTKDREPAS
jgi:hypothetical protein